MKRTLALVLALVMAIGLMAFPVSADFTDDADIKYTEAVDVMSAIGVIVGFEDGSFDPDGYLTREQAAKVVAYLMLGAEDADALTATSAPFDDVAANRWSAGYIAYCVNEGIINGRSDTTFDPTGNVTGYEFAKLMLGCLGYDGAIEKYTGAEWNINVAKTALTVGLFTGNKGANYNVPLTREEAALYAFNMIQADLVDYDNRGSEIDLGNGVTINTGASKAQPITSANEYSTIDDELADKDKEDNNLYVIQFAERYFEDLEKNTSDPDAFGRPSVNWEYDNEDIGTYSETADFTYTTGVKGDDIYDDIDNSDAEYTYYIDGLNVSADDIGDADYYEDFAIANNNDEKIGGNGTLIEIYEGDNDKYTVVVINTYVGEISDWNEADEDNDEKESIIISEFTGPSGLDTTFETTKFDEDDADDNTVIIYTAATDDDGDTYEIKSVDAAEMVTATPTRYTAETSFVAGGETYKYAANFDPDSEVGKSDVDSDEDLDIYLDSYGYVVYTTASGGTDVDYALVIGYDTTSEAFDDDKPIVKLLLATGEIVVADINTDDDEYTEDEKEVIEAANNNPVIITYTVNRDGEYAIDIPSNTAKGTVDSDKSLSVTKGSARVEIENSRFTANSKTVFFVSDETYADSKDADYDAYVGYTNVPSISERDSDTYFYAVYSGDSSVKRLNALFVANGRASNSVDSDIIAVAYDKSADEQYDADLGNFYEFEVVSGDSIETMMFDSDVVSKFATSTDSVVLLSGMSVNEDGVVTDIDKATASDDAYTEELGTVKMEDEIIGLGDGEFAVSDDCAVYKMNSDAEWSTSSVNSVRTDTTDYVSYVLDDDGVVTYIFIREVSGR